MIVDFLFESISLYNGGECVEIEIFNRSSKTHRKSSREDSIKFYCPNKSSLFRLSSKCQNKSNFFTMLISSFIARETTIKKRGAKIT